MCNIKSALVLKDRIFLPLDYDEHEKMIQELNTNELIFINGGEETDKFHLPSPGHLGYAVGHAIGQTFYEFGVIAGTIMVFFP